MPALALCILITNKGSEPLLMRKLARNLFLNSTQFYIAKVEARPW